MQIPAYPVQLAIPLQSNDYLPYLLSRIDAAQISIWASLFIIDARVEKDEARSVRQLIQQLAYARWRNVDVRVIIGTSNVSDIYLACHTSANYMIKQGITVKAFASPYRHSTHSKYLIFDQQHVVIGSHNWSHNALHRSVESSLAIESEGMTQSLAREFNSVWQTSTALNYGD